MGTRNPVPGSSTLGISMLPHLSLRGEEATWWLSVGVIAETVWAVAVGLASFAGICVGGVCLAGGAKPWVAWSGIGVWAEVPAHVYFGGIIMAAFSRKTIGIIHSQQPHNQYAGGGAGVSDSEQRWMRELSGQVVAELATTGHRVLPGPEGDASSTYKENVKWANAHPELDVLISLHSNATGQAGTKATGITCFYVSARGKVIAAALAKRLKPASAAGKASVSDRIRVSELVDTKPPAVLVENEYHDWAGSVTAGGAAWLRDAGNRKKLAKAYRAAVVDLWGDKGAPPAPEPDQPSGPNVPVSPAPLVHTVVAGDTLWSIAAKYLGGGPRYLEIMAANQLESTLIKPGQRLSIPADIAKERG